MDHPECMLWTRPMFRRKVRNLAILSPNLIIFISVFFVLSERGAIKVTNHSQSMMRGVIITMSQIKSIGQVKLTE